MHLVATNLCIWLLMVVQESKHEILHLTELSGDNDHHNQPHAPILLASMNQQIQQPGSKSLIHNNSYLANLVTKSIAEQVMVVQHPHEAMMTQAMVSTISDMLLNVITLQFVPYEAAQFCTG